MTTEKRTPGRPRLFEKSASLSAYMEPEDVAAIKRAAERQTNGNISAYVRKVAKYIQKKEAENE